MAPNAIIKMSTNRQLAAIMFTDIEGYTSLMQNNEKEAVLLRERHRNTFEMTTEAYNGKIIQYFGDGTLSTFKSTVEAVDCAIELQKAFLEEPKVPVRIGIHVGDIIHSKDDIIGDAVNVASRIESCAVSGSILISDKVHDQIRSHKHIKTTFLDAYELKNVEDAMPLFAISNEGLIVPKPEDVKGKLKVKEEVAATPFYKKKSSLIWLILLLALILLIFNIDSISVSTTNEPKDLSIAVLPFDNLSADEDAEFFRDGITEDILTQLSKLKELHVISRTSVMQYKNTKKTIPEIAKELGVSYILEGSIRKYGDDIRITAQLINAASDEHLWAENYDKTLTNIFSLQTEVSKEIVDALELNLSFDEQQGLAIVPTKNIEAYKLFLEGRNEADKRNKESLAKSITLYKEAIILDPDYAEAYAEIANSIYLETYYSDRNVKEASDLSASYLEKAEAINNKVSRIYSVRGLINNFQGNREAADAAFKKAIALSPNDITARHQYSTFFFYSGQYEKQLEQAEIAYRLDPISFPTANSYFRALMMNYEYDRAETLLDNIQEQHGSSNQFVIDRAYFSLYMDQKKYNKAIPHLEDIVKTKNVFNRFLGYSYVQVGDTLSAYRIIDSIRKNAYPTEKSHQLAVVYAALKNTDSVLYHLDTIRNKQTRTFKRENNSFFKYLKDNPEYQKLLKDHGITK